MKGTLQVAATATIDAELKITATSGKIISGKELTVTCDVGGYRLETTKDSEENPTTWTYTVVIEDLVNERTTQINNSASIEVISLGNNGVQKFSGSGGVQVGEVQMKAGSTIVIDPIKTPIYITGSVPTFAEGAKIKLAAEYEKPCYAAGELTLFTWNGTVTATIPEGLFDTTTYPNAVLKQETYTSHRQQEATNPSDVIYTRLYVDLNPGVAKKPLTIMPLGDSITEGTSNNGFGNPNYRSYLLRILAAKGYDVKSIGFRRVKNHDAAGVGMPEKWSWHNGVSGQRLCSSSTRAGWRDALEPTLDASEIPDIITFKIGTNDENTDVDKLFAEWVAVMNRIIAARPSTKIVVGSIMDIYGATWEDDWNKKLRAAIGYNESTKTWNNTPGFPANQVFFADLNKANPRVDEAGNYLGTFEGYAGHSYLHPNWIGHELNAQCWAEAIDRAIAAGAIENNPQYTPNTKTGAAANVGAEYKKGFVHLRTFKPNNAAAIGTSSIAYAASSTLGDDTTFSKIAYYMELKNSRSGNVRWVWVDMDNWSESKKLAAFGVPYNYAKIGQASNIHIDTNDGGIQKVSPETSNVNGWIQFGTGSYQTGTSGAEAPTGFFTSDWNDNVLSSGSYGAMNIYRVAPQGVAGGLDPFAAQTLMAYSRFHTDDQEIGIGNCAIHGTPLVANNRFTTVNYYETYQYERLDLASYDIASIEIWGKPEQTETQKIVAPEADIVVESETEPLSSDYEVVPADLDADIAAGQGGQAQYLTLRATRVGESNNWKVQAVVDNTKLPKNKKIDDTAVAFANAGGIVKLAGATEKQTIQIPKDKTTAGLYYSVSFGTTPDNHTQESERVLATSGEGTVDIPVPALGNEKVYYIKIKASATK